MKIETYNRAKEILERIETLESFIRPILDNSDFNLTEWHTTLARISSSVCGGRHTSQPPSGYKEPLLKMYGEAQTALALAMREEIVKLRAELEVL